ncbi:MAG: DUF624 domain-containing protein [Clostridiales bacterium]|nr:DUF624 domain-containing protein [Clostridiales bacterium]
MALFDKLRGKHFLPGPGVTEPPPARGLKRFGFVLSNHFAKLVYLSVLALLFSLPVFTAPAALCGLTAVCENLVRDGHTFLWDDFWQAFKKGFVRALPGLFLLVFPALALLAWAVNHPLLPWALGLGALATLLCFYLFPLFAQGKKRGFACLTAAVGLALLNWRRTLLLVIPLAVLALILWLGWWALIPLVFGGIAVLCLMSLLILYPVFFEESNLRNDCL